jgi:aspartyl/asparaginyl beta-hydroxylase (cupin superfamily)
MGADGLIDEGDRALKTGDLAAAEGLIERAATERPDDYTLWLRLAGVRRGMGKPRIALEAVHRALALAPRDFAALLMRASLLERLGDPEAGEAWGNALANKPDGELPPQFAAAVTQGEQRHAEWLNSRETRMKARMAGCEARAGEEERKRIGRFRNNALRRSRPYHSSPTHFHFPELAEREFHPRRLFPWIDDLEAATATIANELEAVMQAERAELVPYIQYDDHLPLDQWRPLNRNSDWTAVHLWRNGERIDANARHCPATMAFLQQVPQPAIGGAGPNAMFSLLAPQTSIPAHVGVNNARLVCHLPLVVPEGCWFRVGSETRFWKRGEAFVFDDTIEHEALNPSDQLRVVFIFDIWHPDLTEVERDAVTALIEASDPTDTDGL